MMYQNYRDSNDEYMEQSPYDDEDYPENPRAAMFSRSRSPQISQAYRNKNLSPYGRPGVGGVIPLNKISTGTIDQVYLATRLAITDIVRGNKEALPLIFDDCFAMYDNERLNGALKFLYKNVDSQIIIFTCHTREESALKSNKAKFNYIKIDEN